MTKVSRSLRDYATLGFKLGSEMGSERSQRVKLPRNAAIRLSMLRPEGAWCQGVPFSRTSPSRATIHVDG